LFYKEYEVDGYNLYHCTLGNDELGYINLTDRGGSTYPFSCYGPLELSNDYYVEISEDDFSDAINRDQEERGFMISDRYVDFTDIEINEVKNLLSNNLLNKNWYFYNEYSNYDYEGNYHTNKAVIAVNRSPNFKLKQDTNIF
jgi:hypothetical protein